MTTGFRVWRASILSVLVIGVERMGRVFCQAWVSIPGQEGDSVFSVYRFGNFVWACLYSTNVYHWLTPK